MHKKEDKNTVWREFCFIYGEKHILSLRLTFCLSPQAQIVYFRIFWSIKAMLSIQCGLQYCRSSQHKKTCFKFPFLHCRHNGLLKQETYTTSERWALHCSIENNQVCDLKCLWFNLSFTLYICTVSVKMHVPLVAAFCASKNSKFKFYLSTNCKTPRSSQLSDHNRLCMCVWTKYHNRYAMCTHQKSLWSWS